MRVKVDGLWHQFPPGWPEELLPEKVRLVLNQHCRISMVKIRYRGDSYQSIRCFGDSHLIPLGFTFVGAVAGWYCWSLMR